MPLLTPVGRKELDGVGWSGARAGGVRRSRTELSAFGPRAVERPQSPAQGLPPRAETTEGGASGGSFAMLDCLHATQCSTFTAGELEAGLPGGGCRSCWCWWWATATSVCGCSVAYFDGN